MQPDIEADPCDYYIDLDFLFEPEILFDYSDPAAQVSDTEIERSFQSERDPIGRQILTNLGLVCYFEKFAHE